MHVPTSPTLYEQAIGCCFPRDQSGNEEPTSPASQNKKAGIEGNGDQPLLSCSPNTAGGTSNSRCARFLSNVRTFFTNLWHYKLDVGLGLLGIAGGLVIIFLVDLPTVFGSEALTKGLPFFMIGAGTTKILGAFRNAYVDTCNSGYSINSHFDQYHDVAPKNGVRKDINAGRDGRGERDGPTGRNTEVNGLLKDFDENSLLQPTPALPDQPNSQSNSSSDSSSSPSFNSDSIFSSSSSTSSNSAPASSSSVSTSVSPDQSTEPQAPFPLFLDPAKPKTP